MRTQCTFTYKHKINWKNKGFIYLEACIQHGATKLGNNAAVTLSPQLIQFIFLFSGTNSIIITIIAHS